MSCEIVFIVTDVFCRHSPYVRLLVRYVHLSLTLVDLQWYILAWQIARIKLSIMGLPSIKNVLKSKPLVAESNRRLNLAGRTLWQITDNIFLLYMNVGGKHEAMEK